MENPAVVTVAHSMQIVVDSMELVDPYVVIKVDDDDGVEAVPNECSEDNNVAIIDAQECIDSIP